MTLEEVREIRNNSRATEKNMKERMALFGLTFEDVKNNIGLLTDLLNKKFREILADTERQKPKYWVKTNPVKYEKSRPNGTYNYIFITATGTYFEAREVITFCDSGFVGFCGEADDINEIPVLEVFGAWLTNIKKDKNKMAHNEKIEFCGISCVVVKTLINGQVASDNDIITACKWLEQGNASLIGYTEHDGTVDYLIDAVRQVNKNKILKLFAM